MTPSNPNPPPPTTTAAIVASIDAHLARLQLMRAFVLERSAAFDAVPQDSGGVCASLPYLFLHDYHGPAAKALAKALGGTWKREPQEEHYNYCGKVPIGADVLDVCLFSAEPLVNESLTLEG